MKHNDTKGRGWIVCIAALLLVSGIGVILFPHLEEALYREESRNKIAHFEIRRTEQQNESDPPLYAPDAEQDTYLPELRRAMEAYNAQLYATGQSALTDPFAYEAPSFDLAEWGTEQEMFGYIDIPAMSVTLPIYLGASVENMKKGVVHLSETSLPIGGENTNCVIAGHRGFHGAPMFREIEALQPGDAITVVNPWETLTYRVSETRVIQPDEIEKVLIQPGRDLITLITCHPYRYNYQRYAVYCERTENSKG